MAKKKRNKNAVKESFLEIDLNNLEVEWQEQPKLFFKWARKLANARRVLDEAKAEQDLVMADLDAEIRAKPKKYGLNAEKVTEPAIKKTIMTQEEYTDAQTKVINAKHDVGLYEAGVEALNHRKRALEKEVELFGMDYFSMPRVSGKTGQEAKRKLDRSVRRRYRRDDD